MQQAGSSAQRGWLSGPGLDLGPGPGPRTFGITRQRLQGVERAHCRLGRVQVRVVADRRIDQIRGVLVRVRVANEITDRRNHLRLQQVVDEAVGVLRIFRALRDREHVEPDRRAFFRQAHINDDAVLGFLGAVGSWEKLPE